MRNSIWVIGTAFSDSFAGLINKGRDLAAERSLTLTAVCVREKLPERDILEMSAAGAQTILHLPFRSGMLQDEFAIQSSLTSAIREENPTVVLFESCVAFRSIAPAISAKLGCGITADCTDLRWKTGEDVFYQIRPAFGGRYLAVIETATMPAMATVCRGAFRKTKIWPATGGVEVRLLPAKENSTFWRLMGFAEKDKNIAELSGAKVVLSGGMGLGSSENFKKLFRLAEMLHVSVGASRAAVSAGFATYEHQVGLTGISVRPRLYVAFGISGAVQHLSGIMGSEFICAVNNDPKAPIHDYCAYSVIADCNKVLDELLRKVG